MQALRIERPTPAAAARLREVPAPPARDGWVRIAVRAFGLNNSERLVRLEEIGSPWIAPAVIPGIECAGVVLDAPGTVFAPGQRVIACMGGMGREFDGSYAQVTSVPASHVFAVPAACDWSWEELGAFPETYLTAWGSLDECLHLAAGDTLLVRGGTCALGRVALQLARAAGAQVVATARKRDGLAGLLAAGAHVAVLDAHNKLARLSAQKCRELATHGAQAQEDASSTSAFLSIEAALESAGATLEGEVPPVNKALELVGCATLANTLRVVGPGGCVCVTGTLGGVETLSHFDPIKSIPNGCALTSYFSNFPTQATFDAIWAFMAAHKLRPLVGRRFAFEILPAALAAQEAGAGEKLVVVV
jgi:NADPH:quinone reductase-like Zn-dependent oxidoreductase